jgi:glycosyltransferase involved in cell wall biosynthesis
VKNITIAYVSEASPNDKHAWSGTVHYVYKTLLDMGYTVNALGPRSPVILKFLLATLNKISLSLFRKRLDYRHSIIYSKAYGRIFNRQLKKNMHDVVVVCGNTECGAFIESKSPVIYVLDRTIAGALNYHTILTSLWPFSQNQSLFTDQKAMLESRKIFFSSQWAADHAHMYYGINPKKIIVQPFGANLDRIPSREEALVHPLPDHLKLLLVGTYWYNKGADIAFNTMLLLREKGINASLTVVGCEPPGNISHEHLHIIPFVDKNSPSGIRQLWELFRSHHFFILPTRFDCTPIVFCEASAFALPILSADTGGVRGHITEGVNGFLIPYEDKGEAYAEKISTVMTDHNYYQSLRVSTRDHYERKLNWEAWGQRFRAEISQDILNNLR